MKVLIAQLSDIHIKSADDEILQRGAKIGEAIKSRAHDAGACILVLTGDITYSGQEDEYLAALDLLDTLQKIIEPALLPPGIFRIIGIPGNHDLDLSEAAGEVRALVVETLRKRQASEIDASMIEVCAAPQSQFFSFRAAVDGSTPPTGDMAYYEYLIELERDAQIRVRCCNTALTSVKQEQVGNLYYPWERVRRDQQSALIDITLLHHPYHWFTPVVNRALRKRIEEVSDVVLTGHEHTFSAGTRSGWDGETNLYIEGGALQGHGASPKESTFNVVLVDTAPGRQLLVRFDWNGELYASTEKGWQPYQANQVRFAHRMTPNERTLRWLANPEVSLEHSQKGLVVLDDIFVYPDLGEVHFPIRRDVRPPIRSDRILGITAEQSIVYINGEEKSGKTCLAKRLFTDAYGDGLVPVLIAGTTLSVKNADEVADLITDEFVRQYDKRHRDAYLQLDPSRRVVIIDDFQKSAGVAGSLKLLTEAIETFAGRVIVFGGHFAQQLQAILDPSIGIFGDTNRGHYRILPYGHARKNEVVEKWCALDTTLAADGQALAAKLVRSKRVLDTALANNVMPSYPLFMLPLLQALDHGDDVDLHASTYGYYYELLIRRALSRQTTKERFDVKLEYLAHVAFTMFDKNVGLLTDSEMRRVHASFEEDKLIDLSFITLQQELASSGVLANDGERYWFAYPYIFYYFLASYLRDRIKEERVRTIIGQLAGTLHDERSANTMLFLAHLSKDSLIAEELLRIGKTVFLDRPRLALGGEERALSIEEGIQEITYVDRGADGRRHAMESMDAADREQEESRRELDRSLATVQDKVSQFGMAFKTLQILGQVVKNFPGSLDGQVKKDIVDECYGIGLRAGAEFFAMIEMFEESIVQVSKTLKVAEARLNEDSLAKKARESIYFMTQLFTFSTVKRIANAVGSPDLFRVYDLVGEKYDTPSVALVRAALELDHNQTFPEDDIIALYEALDGNALAQSVLRGLVVTYFHVAGGSYKSKQRVCEKLHINYRRLIGKGKEGRSGD